MDYDTLVSHLFSLNQKRGIKYGLSRCLELSAFLDHPEKAFSSIHIAGSNGKGSVATKIAAALAQDGHKVGLFTSPHIHTFRERIRVNGAMISCEEVAYGLNQLFSLAKTHALEPTFFEFTTLLALCHFRACGVDYAVIETGLGGRLDATNIITPALAVITSISLEHTETLGNTRKKIAQEKAGIIKDGCPVVLGPRAQEVVVPKKSACVQLLKQFRFFEEENQAIARAALEKLGVSESAIEQGIQTSVPCRAETVWVGGEKVILDAAHNPDALQRLFQMLGQGKWRMVCGFSKNKDLAACLGIICEHVEQIHLVQSGNERAATPEKLQQTLLEQGVEDRRIFMHENVSDAVDVALKLAKEKGQDLLISGTFFILGEAKDSLNPSSARNPS